MRSNKKQKRWAIVLVIVSSTAIFACASLKRQKQYEESIPLVHKGDYEQASLVIQEAKEDAYREKDRVLYYLDLGMLYHWSGEYELSNELLTQAENAIEELYTASLSKAVASGLVNDNLLDYSGEDYEDIYLNMFKALNYIALGLKEDALVEIRRVQIKLNLLEDKHRKSIEAYNESEDAKREFEFTKSRFHNDALARYVGLLLYRAEGLLDDARIEKELIDEAWETQKQLYDFPKPTLPLIELPAEEKAIVNFISFSGLSPTKLADTVRITTENGTLFLTITGRQNKGRTTELIGFEQFAIPGIKEGIRFKVQFPRLSKRSSIADRIIVKLDGIEHAELELLESMENLSEETFNLKQPLRVGKTLIRASMKAIAKEIGKDVIDKQVGGVGGFFAKLGADIAVDASERADLRVSQFFPASAHVAELALDPGSYHVTIEYWGSNFLLKTIDHGTRYFNSDELNLVESFLLL